MQKRLHVFLIVMLLLGSMSAVSAAAETTIVEFWYPHTGIDRDTILDLVTEFNNGIGATKGIEVRATYVPTTAGSQTSEKLLTSIAGGNPPDVAWFDRFLVGSWAARNSLTDLTSLAARDGISADQYFPFAWEEASYKGRLYALPYDTDDRALYYNKSLFRDAGLNPESPPVYTSDLDAAAEKITRMDSDGRVERMGFVPWLNQGQLYTWGWAFGGSFFDPGEFEVTLTDPRIVAALEWEATYAERYGSATIDSFSDSFGSEALDPFLTGLIGMKSDGDWTLANIRKYNPDLDFGVAPLPYPRDGGEPNSTWAGGWSVVIPRGSEDVDAAWEFIKWFAGPDAQTEYALRTSHIPTNREAAEQEIFYEDPNHAIFMDLLPTAHNRPVIPEGNLLWQELLQVVEFVRFDRKSAEEALEDANQKVNRALQRWK